MAQPAPEVIHRWRCNRCGRIVDDSRSYICRSCETHYRSQEGRSSYGPADPDATDAELDRDDPGIPSPEVPWT